MIIRRYLQRVCALSTQRWDYRATRTQPFLTPETEDKGKETQEDPINEQTCADVSWYGATLQVSDKKDKLLTLHSEKRHENSSFDAAMSAS